MFASLARTIFGNANDRSLKGYQRRVPEINAHYCIGVLWTIPVQLQYTYVVLAATVVIRDVRTPWKRFGLYTLVILAGWYARVSSNPSPSLSSQSKD